MNTGSYIILYIIIIIYTQVMASQLTCSRLSVERSQPGIVHTGFAGSSEDSRYYNIAQLMYC